MTGTRFRWTVIILLVLLIASVVGSLAFTVLNDTGAVCRFRYKALPLQLRKEISDSHVEHLEVTNLFGVWPKCMCDVKEKTLRLITEYEYGETHSRWAYDNSWARPYTWECSAFQDDLADRWSDFTPLPPP